MGLVRFDSREKRILELLSNGGNVGLTSKTLAFKIYGPLEDGRKRPSGHLINPQLRHLKREGLIIEEPHGGDRCNRNRWILTEKGKKFKEEKLKGE